MFSASEQFNQRRDSSALTTILERSLVRPYEDGDIGTAQLSEKEREQLQVLWDKLIPAYKKNQFRIVFRGEKKRNLEKKLFRQSGDYHPGKMYNRLFYFGEKAKHYFNYNTNNQGQNLNYLQHIRDTSDTTYIFIFDQINKIFTGYYEFSQGNSQAISNFRESEAKFSNFFCSTNNKERFIEIINEKVTDQVDKEKLRDHYLYLLHTFGSRKQLATNLSFFVSTSEDEEEAKRFALLQEKKNRSVLFVYMVPEPLCKYGVSRSVLNSLYEEYRDTGIPLYKTELYDSKKIAIKGALFPHYILGLQDLGNDKFIVNPHIFKQPKSRLVEIPLSGLLIEQEDFDEMINDTGYTGYVRRMSDVYLVDKKLTEMMQNETKILNDHIF